MPVPPADLPFRLCAAATVVAGMRDHERAHQVAEVGMIAALAAEVWAARADLDPADLALLLSALGASAAGGYHIATSTHLPDPRGNDRGFLRGVACYAAAQLAYSALLWRRGARPHAGGAAGRLVFLGAGLGLIAWQSPRQLPALSGYGGLLAGTALLAADPRLAGRAHADLRSGGWAFMASDLLILGRRWLLRAPTARAGAEGVMLSLYALAQRRLTRGLLSVLRER